MNSRGRGGKIAAWLRVEGVLVRKGVISLAAYLASNAQGFSDRVIKLGMVALARPFGQVFAQGDPAFATRLAYFALRDMSEDRLFILGKEYFDNILSEALLSQGLDLLRRLNQEGYEVILYSEGLGCALSYLSPHLKQRTQLFCNELEYCKGLATGKLAEPILSGHAGSRYLLQRAQEQGYDLAHSAVYSSNDQDILLLNAVGKPCAVNPSAALRREARQLDWPIMEY